MVGGDPPAFWWPGTCAPLLGTHSLSSGDGGADGEVGEPRKRFLFRACRSAHLVNVGADGQQSSVGNRAAVVHGAPTESSRKQRSVAGGRGGGPRHRGGETPAFWRPGTCAPLLGRHSLSSDVMLRPCVNPWPSKNMFFRSCRLKINIYFNNLSLEKIKYLTHISLVIKNSVGSGKELKDRAPPYCYPC